MIILTQENYKQTASENDILVIDFWAQWCVPCKSYAPLFEKVSKTFPDITFAKVHAEEETTLSDHFFIQNLPTTVLMKEGTVIFKKPGLLSEAELTVLIEEVRVLDMEQFRLEKEKRKAARRG